MMMLMIVLVVNWCLSSLSGYRIETSGLEEVREKKRVCELYRVREGKRERERSRKK